MIWEEVLAHGFASDVTGLIIVLQTKHHVHTFNVTHGVVKHHGEGDFHDPEAALQLGFVINNPSQFNEYTPSYRMDISTNAFVDSFHVGQPWIFLIAAIILVPTLLFFLYDFNVRKEFDNKNRLMEAKRQFVRMVSHEVRTPLNTICMGLALLRDDFSSRLHMRQQAKQDATLDGGSEESTLFLRQDENQLQEWLLLSSQISENAESAVNILTDLLNYDKIQMGTLALELTPVPIGSLVQKTFEEFRMAAQEKKVDFVLNFGDNLDKDVEAEMSLSQRMKGRIVVGDAIRLSQILRNLISNGLKFTKENGE